MFLAKVTGNMVSTMKHKAFTGLKIMVVHKTDPQGNLEPESFLAIDQVQAGVGDTVLLLLEGSSARTVLGNDTAPIRAIIMGIVDTVTLKNECFQFS